MNLILLLACAGLITGLFVLLKISPCDSIDTSVRPAYFGNFYAMPHQKTLHSTKECGGFSEQPDKKIAQNLLGSTYVNTIVDLTQNIFKQFEGRQQSLKDSLNEATNRKKQGYFKREISEVKAILEMTGRAHKFPQVSALSMLFFIIGGSIAIMLGNWILAPVMAVGFMFLPFWYIKLTQVYFKKDLANELETALSIITTGYLRSENIVTAIEENLEYLHPPILSVFYGFIYRIRMIDPDIVSGLQDMKGKINNPVFKEWIEAVILCQHDRSLKSTLTPITGKLSDMRIVNAELETLVTQPRQEFLTMVALVICNIPLLYFLNQDWYNTLMHSLVGHIVLAVCALAIFISLAFVVKLTQPIEYKR